MNHGNQQWLDLLVLLLLVVVVLLGSALCSGVEAAMLTVNPIRVPVGCPPSAGGRSATSGSAAAASGKNPVRAGDCEQWLQHFRQPDARWLCRLGVCQRGIGGIALPLFSIGLTVLVMLLGEILPKALGSRLALPVSLASAPFLHWLGLLLQPLVLLLERLLPAITAEAELSTNEDEIRLLARLGSQKGQIEADEAAMIGKVFQLNDLTARDLMTPRVAAPTLDGALSLEAQRQLLLDNNAAWWVVLGDQVDKVLGVASRERLLTALLENRGLLTPADLSESVDYVPEMIRADRLLTGFRGTAAESAWWLMNSEASLV